MLHVVSAFGGFAIYKMKKIKHCAYDGKNREKPKTTAVWNAQDCEHIAFHVDMMIKHDAPHFISSSILFAEYTGPSKTLAQGPPVSHNIQEEIVKDAPPVVEEIQIAEEDEKEEDKPEAEQSIWQEQYSAQRQLESLLSNLRPDLDLNTISSSRETSSSKEDIVIDMPAKKDDASQHSLNNIDTERREKAALDAKKRRDTDLERQRKKRDAIQRQNEEVERQRKKRDAIQRQNEEVERQRKKRDAIQRQNEEVERQRKKRDANQRQNEEVERQRLARQKERPAKLEKKKQKAQLVFFRTPVGARGRVHPRARARQKEREAKLEKEKQKAVEPENVARKKEEAAKRARNERLAAKKEETRERREEEERLKVEETRLQNAANEKERRIEKRRGRRERRRKRRSGK